MTAAELLLVEIVAGRTSAAAVPLEEVPALAGRLEEVRMALQIRASSPAPVGLPKDSTAGDRLLTAQEVAKMVTLSPDWVYANQEEFDVVKIGKRGRVVRFPERAVRRYLRTRGKASER